MGSGGGEAARAEEDVYWSLLSSLVTPAAHLGTAAARETTPLAAAHPGQGLQWGRARWQGVCPEDLPHASSCPSDSRHQWHRQGFGASVLVHGAREDACASELRASICNFGEGNGTGR